MHEGDGCRAYRVAVALILVPFNLLVRHKWRDAERLPRSGAPPAVPFDPRPLRPVPDADDVRRSA